MALSASTVWEVRTGGNDTNGGGFVTGSSGTNWSLQNAAQYSVADGVTAGTTTITSATANFGTDIVGNIMYVQGGTGSITAGWYQIATRVNATTITVDRSTGLTAGTGVTLNIGGALLSPAIAASVAVGGNIIYIKNDGSNFSITSASNNVAGGCINSAFNIIYTGYTTTRSQLNSDTSPTIQLNVSTATLLPGSAIMTNIIFDGNNQTTAKFCSGGLTLILCTIKNFNTASTGGGTFVGCLLTGNSAAVLAGGGTLMYSESYANTATPWFVNTVINCLSYSNTGGSTDGGLNGGTATCSGLTSVANGRDGIRSNNVGGGNRTILNSYFQSNTGWGINGASLSCTQSWGNGFYNNTLGQTTALGSGGFSVGSITVSGDAFTNLAGNVYSLNNLANQGALLRATAIPALFPRGLTPDYADVNCVQHQDSPANISVSSMTTMIIDKYGSGSY